MIQRHSVSVSGRQVHYRRSGSGPAMVLLHALPRSSGSLEPLMNELASDRTVIALDLPGFGESAPLPIDEPAITDFSDFAAATFDALGFGRVDLYGTHTGAVTALDFAVRWPSRVRTLVLDGLPVFDDAEQAEIVDRYCPSIEPEWDGSHLVRIWAWRRDTHIFWPWYRRQTEARLKADLISPDAIYAQVLDVLRAGPNYGRGYRAAFRANTLSLARRLAVPAVITADPADPLAGYLPRLTDLPANVRVVSGDGQGSRAGLIRDQWSVGLNLPADDPPPARRDPLAPDQIRLEYPTTSVGNLLVRRSGPESGRPIILFHASPGTSAGLEPLIRLLGQTRPVYAFDTPGFGDSAAVPGEPAMWDIATVVLEALDSLGIAECDAYGALTGSLVAAELALAAPDRIRHLILDGLPLYRPEEAEDLLAHHAPAMPLDTNGMHMLWAWNIIRDRHLWFPWHDRTVRGAQAPRVQAPFPSTDQLHTNVVEFLKGGLTYHHAYRAVFRYPARDRLPRIAVPTLFTAGERSVMRRTLDRAAASVPGSRTALVPGSGAFSADPIAVGTIDQFTTEAQRTHRGTQRTEGG